MMDRDRRLLGATLEVVYSGVLLSPCRPTSQVFSITLTLRGGEGHVCA